MNHIRFDIKDRQNNEGKVIVSRNEHLLTRVPGILAIRKRIIRIRTISVRSGGTHYRSSEVILIRANCDLEIIIGALGKGFINMKANDHPPGFIFDGWKPGILNFL